MSVDFSSYGDYYRKLYASKNEESIKQTETTSTKSAETSNAYETNYLGLNDSGANVPSTGLNANQAVPEVNLELPCDTVSFSSQSAEASTIGSRVGDGIDFGIKTITDTSLRDIGAGVVKMSSNLWGGIKSVGSAIGKGIVSVGKAIGKAIGAIGKAIGSIFDKIRGKKKGKG